MRKLPFNKVLVLSPHADDAELGAGGTIARLLREGAEVYMMTFSLGNAETGATFEELKRAASVFGFEVYDTPPNFVRCRHFQEHRQQILDRIIYRRDMVGPDLIIAPSTTDAHQDHQVIAAEAIRTCKGLTLWAYEQPWNTVWPFHPNVFVSLSAKDMGAKIGAVARYGSQSRKPYTQRHAIKAVAETRGLQAGVFRAEAFEVVRWVT